jgi:hypothetical protein
VARSPPNRLQRVQRSNHAFAILSRGRQLASWAPPGRNYCGPRRPNLVPRAHPPSFQRCGSYCGGVWCWCVGLGGSRRARVEEMPVPARETHLAGAYVGPLGGSGRGTRTRGNDEWFSAQVSRGAGQPGQASCLRVVAGSRVGSSAR